MAFLRLPRKAVVTAAVFGLAPCVLGVAIAQYLRWRGTVWLSDAGWFWPIVCTVTSIVILISIAASSSKDRTARLCGWLIVAWTWLYVPLWLTAREIPQSSAVVPRDGRVFVAGAPSRQPTDKVWLLTGRAGDKIVRNVTGAVTVRAAVTQYRYSEAYISTRSNGEDLATPVVRAANALLTEEAEKPRASRIALFDKGEVHDQFLGKLCRAIVPDQAGCPLKLSLSAQAEASIPGAVWSRAYTENEAIDEKHLPTLVQLLIQDNSRLLDRDRVFAMFMKLANTPEVLSAVARKSSVLDAYQFDEVVKRILTLPGCGSEAILVLLKVNRLTDDHRRELRLKMLREANLALIANNAAALRISDAEIVQLAARMQASSELSPDVAVLLLETFGERLPFEAQHEAIAAIVEGNAAHALAALKSVNFSSSWREKLLRKVVSDATYQDFEAARLSREALEDLLTPAEMRSLVASVVKKSETSTKWLAVAVRLLPVRAMTPSERGTVINALLFESTKSAVDFVSENRHHLAATDVNDITRDYARTIERDFCLHLSHRNKNRKTDYFSETQLQIFRDCAQSK